MSSFVLRQGEASFGDEGFDEALNKTVELVDKLKTENPYSSFWIAKDSTDQLFIVDEYELTDIGCWE